MQICSVKYKRKVYADCRAVLKKQHFVNCNYQLKQLSEHLHEQRQGKDLNSPIPFAPILQSQFQP